MTEVLHRSIAVVSGKGGVGKSTVSAHVGRALAEAGRRVLLVDCDPGLNSLGLLLDRTDAVYSWLDLAKDGCDAADALLEAGENLFFLPAPAFLPESTETDLIASALEKLDETFDYVLFDAPAGIGTGLKRAIGAANAVIAVATPDEISVRGAERVAAIAEEAGLPGRLLVNRFDYKAAKKGKTLSIDEVIDKTYLRLLGVVPEDKELTFFLSQGLSKKSRSAQAFVRIAGRVEGKNTPLTLSLLK